MDQTSISPSSDPVLRRGQRVRRAGRTVATKARRGILACLGPGLITGASDDDPSGIATYSQAGAQYGFAMLWVMPLTLPLMAAIQEISARIGRVTGRGIARNLRLHYPGWVVSGIVLIVVIANIINLGADIGAMGEALRLVTGGPAWLHLVYALAFAAGSLVVQILLSYERYTAILKYLTAAMLVYIVTGFIVHAPWRQVLFRTFVPVILPESGYIALLVGVLGTTISPYLFFWQATMESEHVMITPGVEPLRKEPGQAPEALRRIKLDTYVGMTFSNLLAFFIILCTAATLHTDPHTRDIQSASQAAEALQPLAAKVAGPAAGKLAEVLFALGIISGGLLAIPSLAASAAYAVAELFRWPVGLQRKPHKAKGFYLVLSAATLLGALMIFSPINPIKALVWAAVLNGLVAVPVMVMIMLMFSNRKIMGQFTRGTRWLRAFGWLATAAMAAAAIGFFATLR